MPTREPVDGEIVSGQSCGQSVASTSYPAPHMFYIHDDRDAIFRKQMTYVASVFQILAVGNLKGWVVHEQEKEWIDFILTWMFMFEPELQHYQQSCLKHSAHQILAHPKGSGIHDGAYGAVFPDLGSSAPATLSTGSNNNVLGKLKWSGWHTTQHHVTPVGCEECGCSMGQPTCGKRTSMISNLSVCSCACFILKTALHLEWLQRNRLKFWHGLFTFLLDSRGFLPHGDWSYPLPRQNELPDLTRSC